MRQFQIIFLLIVVGLMSCSPRYSFFTHDLYENQKWTQEDLRRIQFFVSRDILLTRSFQEGQTRIAEGKILIKNGQRIEQVVIREGTPGVLIFMPRDDRFGISFESDDEAYLMFGPNPKYHNRFALLAQDWDRTEGKLHYRGNVYTVPAGSAFASLMVDLRKTGDTRHDRHVAQGRRLKS